MSLPVTTSGRNTMTDWQHVAMSLIRRTELWPVFWFMFSSFVLGLFWFCLLIVLLPVGAAMSIVWIGIPILAATVAIWTGAARFERRRVGWLTGTPIPDPYRPLSATSWWGRFRGRLGDWAVWRDLVYLFLLFPIGLIELVVVAGGFGLVVSLISAPLYFWTIPGGISVGDPAWGGGQVDSLAGALLLSVAGMVIAIPVAWAMIGVARAHVVVAWLLLGPSSTEQLEERVEVLTKSRSGVIDAQLAERRRIERDLHDGAQQRLVALAMDLGMAREKMTTDPEQARHLVETSHDEAKRVLAELRNLVRGIHPAVLSDRGLDAAISAIAGRSPIPVTVDVQLPHRPPEPVEAAAYFVVLEALANVAKHSRASEAWVVARERDGWLWLEIMDNGVGGVDSERGTGLSGLRDRVDALDGRLTVDSPRGGPTRLRVEIPCGS
ncbi:MAG: sensor domain-containing protein [Chloroflexia bacterium]|nr:sensor domain-containing protein [Chloroflexia bacterium]MDQ3412096.1 sensor histidine kinase [Chloroflexota bacterium]